MALRAKQGKEPTPWQAGENLAKHLRHVSKLGGMWISLARAQPAWRTSMHPSRPYSQKSR